MSTAIDPHPSTVAPNSSMRRRLRWWIISSATVLPLLVAAIVLTQRTWYPVLDMAMTEFRVRDVGTSHTPLIGLPGRIGSFPDNQGSHPGPWSFYLLAPAYRLAGATAYGMQLGSVLVNASAALVTLWIVHRRGRPVVTLAVAAALAVALRGYGLVVLTQPWNPYFPLLLWLLVMFATWAVLEGDTWMVLFVVGAGSVAAQTHVPYLLPCLAMNALALGVIATRIWRGEDRRHNSRALVASFGVGALMWLAPFVDQLIRDPGNIRRLIVHFTGEPDEEVIGISGGTEVLIRHFDLPSAIARMIGREDAFVWISGVESGIRPGGVLVLAAWVVSVVAAYRLRHRPLLHLHTIVAVATAVGWFSVSRIFGKVWYYLALWLWGVALVAVVAAAWTLAAWWRSHRRSDAAAVARISAWVAGVTLAVTTALSLVAVVDLEVPEQQISDSLGATIEPTTAAIDAGVGASVGPDGRYLVFWQDAAFIGSPGYGLVNELERRGYHVGVEPTWRTPVTEHRVLRPGEYDAEIHLATGVFVDQWRERPGFVEVATVDVRTDDERERFEELERRVVARLRELGREEVVPLVSENLFGADLAPDLADDVKQDLAEMLRIFVPVSVFIAPARPA